MPPKVYVCNLCKDEGNDYSVPADEFGVAFMKEHLWEKHGVRPPNTIRREL